MKLLKYLTAITVVSEKKEVIDYSTPQDVQLLFDYEAFQIGKSQFQPLIQNFTTRWRHLISQQGFVFSRPKMHQ